MLIPAILAGMIEANEARRAADEGPGIGALGDVAPQAGKRKICRGGGTTLFAAYDVIDVEGKTGIGLMNETIFADSMRPLDDQAAQAHGNRSVHAADERLRVRALAFAKLIT